MVEITPYRQRVIALSAFLLIGSLMIGSSVYQTYFQNPVQTLPYQGEIEPFTMPSIDNKNYLYIPSNYEVTIVSFIYTKCPGDSGCALLTTNMANLYDRVLSREWTTVQFISIDFDYINDTMEDLRHYAEENTDNRTYWEFLLGNENKTKEVADQFNFFFAPNNQSSVSLSHGTIEGEDKYIHQMTTYMLDREGNIRKFISGTSWDFIEIMNSIEFLKSNNWEN